MTSWNTEPYAILNALSGLAFVAMGGLALGIPVQRRMNRALALFAIGFGWGIMAFNLFDTDASWLAWLLISGALGFIVAAGGLAWLAIETPRRGRVPNAAILVPLAYLGVVAWAQWDTWSFAANGMRPAVSAAIQAGSAILYVAQWFALLLFALRFPELQGPERRQSMFIATAVAISPAFRMGMDIIGERPVSGGLSGLATGGPVMQAVAGTAVLLIVAGIWLRNTERSEASVWTAWTIIIAIIAGMLHQMLGLDAWGAPGLARMASMAVLTYAVLRHQALGVQIDRMNGLQRLALVSPLAIALLLIAVTGEALFGWAPMGPLVAALGAAAIIIVLRPVGEVGTPPPSLLDRVR